MLIGGVDAHQHRVERKTPYALHQSFRAMVPRHAEESNGFLAARLLERLDRPAFAEHLLDIAHRTDVVELPDVHMVGLEQFQGLFEHSQRTVTGPVFGLGGDKGLFAAPFQHLPDIAFAGPLRPTIDGRRIDVVPTEIQCPFYYGHGNGVIIHSLEGGLSTETEDRDAMSSFAEVPRRHWGSRRLILCRSRCGSTRDQAGGRYA